MCQYLLRNTCRHEIEKQICSSSHKIKIKFFKIIALNRPLAEEKDYKRLLHSFSDLNITCPFLTQWVHYGIFSRFPYSICLYKSAMKFWYNGKFLKAAI